MAEISEIYVNLSDNYLITLFSRLMKKVIQ